jgi:hypothetical protein
MDFLVLDGWLLGGLGAALAILGRYLAVYPH